MSTSVSPSSSRKEGSIPAKADRLAALLEAALSDGRYSLGDRFPSTHDIAREYGVSQGTAHKAMSQLVERGYLQTSHRSGYFLRPEGVELARQKRAATSPPVATLLVLYDQIGDWGRQVLDEYVEALAQAVSHCEWEVLQVRNHKAEIDKALLGRQVMGCFAYYLWEPPASEAIDLSSVIGWGGNPETWSGSAHSILSLDQEQASRLAFEHLWDLGHQRTALVRPQWWTNAIYPGGSILGMRKAYAAMGHVWTPEDIVLVSQEQRGTLYRDLCERGITGVRCDEWHLVHDLYQQAQQAGEQIGDRLSIVGIGGSDIVSQLDPAPARVRWRAMDYASIVLDAIEHRLSGDVNGRKRPMPRQLTLPIYLDKGAGARPPRELS